MRKAPRDAGDLRAAARALRPLIEAQADEGERIGQVTEAAVRGIAKSGLWGAMIPRDLGGSETTPDVLIDVVEELSYADGSTGWIYMATIFAIANAAVWFGPSAVDAVFNTDGCYICAGQISKLGRAERVEGGWRVSGTFQFGSGAYYSSWLLGAFAVEQDGKPVLLNGKPHVIVAFGPRRNVRFRGNWDVMGLAATGSVDFEFIEQIVADDFVMNLPGRVRRGGPLYEIGVSLGHAAWATGVALRALDEVTAIAQRKRRFARSPLIEQPVFQRDWGNAWAGLEGARAAMRKVFAEWYEAAQAGKPSLEVRARARLVSSWLTDVAAKTTEFAYRAAGSDGLRNHDGANKLQRCFRDIYAGTQHRHIDTNVLIEASTALLGIAPPDLDL
jgi:alkylation response protein AidB-like acyl-CoA dehydrogenase